MRQSRSPFVEGRGKREVNRNHFVEGVRGVPKAGVGWRASSEKPAGNLIVHVIEADGEAKLTM